MQQHCRGTSAPCAPYRTNHTSVDMERARFSGHSRTHTCHASSPRAALRTSGCTPWHPRAVSKSRAGGCSHSRLRSTTYASELRVRVEFEQAGMCACGRLLGCRVHQKVQKAGHARARQRICGRLRVLARGTRRALTFRGPPFATLFEHHLVITSPRCSMAILKP